MKAIIFTFLVITLFTSCDNDDDNAIETCTNHGLFYTLDTDAEVYLPQGGFGMSTTIYTESAIGTGDNVMVHELENNYIFQSSALDVNQTSLFNSDISSSEASHLYINGVLSNPQSVNITFTCLVNEGVVGGTIRYSFVGTFTSNMNIQHTIEGEVCVIIETIN